jgi:hypothetical protein
VDDRLPPPPGFTGYEKREYGSFGYERSCTPEEAELLEADAAAMESQQLADEEALRDAWFRMLSESQQPET